MKKAMIFGACVCMCAAVSAKGGHSSPAMGTGSSSLSHSTSGYVKSNGTYVAPSHATNPNSTVRDNYRTRGNVNPYTGKPGTK